jgi:hypothetical protein
MIENQDFLFFITHIIVFYKYNMRGYVYSDLFVPFVLNLCVRVRFIISDFDSRQVATVTSFLT